MNPPLERVLVKKTLERLRTRGGFWVKIHGSPLQIAGLPDIIGCYRGRFVGLEAKREGGKPTRLQLYTMGKIREAGGMTSLIYSVKDAMDILDRIDELQEAESS